MANLAFQTALLRISGSKVLDSQSEFRQGSGGFSNMVPEVQSLLI